MASFSRVWNHLPSFTEHLQPLNYKQAAEFWPEERRAMCLLVKGGNIAALDFI